MSVMIETSLGDLVIDLFCKEAPLAAKNFIKLCKIKYYNGCLFYNVQQNFMIQTGDPTATGKGGTSLYGLIYGDQARFFEDEFGTTSRKHDEAGLVSMANMGVPNSNGSQFFFSMRGEDMQHLDGKHTIFAKVMEGMDTLEAINGQFCDDNGRPYRDLRILHTYVLDDPFDDPPQLVIPDESPSRERPEEEMVPQRLGALDKVSLEVDEGMELEREKQVREKTARSNAVVLEMIGDLPDADMKPPENVLFVCKLNPVTTDDDLEIIFTRFGNCRAEIIRDHITGESLNYSFVEFDAVESCEEAYKKMHNVLIDDRRIRVDFSQSVAKEWSKYKGRAQGGQKLASGKGGKATQQQQSGGMDPVGKPTPIAAIKSDVGSQRRSKWNNAPSSMPEPTALPAREGRSRGDASRERSRDEDRTKRGSRWGDGALGDRVAGSDRDRGDGRVDDRLDPLRRGEGRPTSNRQKDGTRERLREAGSMRDGNDERRLQAGDEHARGRRERHERKDARDEGRRGDRHGKNARERSGSDSPRQNDSYGGKYRADNSYRKGEERVRHDRTHHDRTWRSRSRSRERGQEKGSDRGHNRRR
ncbi:unnamed protein product [Ascophyllum nodosum]